MNSQQQKILERIFALPVDANIEWRKIEALLVSLGCQRVEGRGSSVMFSKAGINVYFHRPHPQREALRYRVVDANKFLEAIGVKP